jgi:hypothetical protein
MIDVGIIFFRCCWLKMATSLMGGRVATGYQIFKPYNLFYLRIEGEVKLMEVSQSRLQILNDPDFTPTLSQLVDLRFAQAGRFSVEEIRSLASSTIFERGIKRALVAPADLEFGIARMFEVFNEPHGQEVRVFRSLEEACQWLGVPIEALKIS